MESAAFVCVSCPIGCQLVVSRAEDGAVKVSGNKCARGKTYGEQEFTRPQRVLTTSVAVIGGDLPLCPVKTSASIDKTLIIDGANFARQLSVAAPVDIGQVIAPNFMDSGADLIATGRVIKID